MRLDLEGQHQPGGDPATVSIIRNGDVVYTTQLEDSPFTLHWRDAAPLPQPRAYYRVMIRRSQNSRIVTNPTFVQRHVP